MAIQPPGSVLHAVGPRWSPTTLRAAWWAHRALRVTKRRLRRDGLLAVAPAPPVLPVGASRGVVGVLRRRSDTCLERALVLQAWLRAHGELRDVVIGVRKGGAGFEAHAWVDAEGLPDGAGEYDELHRRAP